LDLREPFRTDYNSIDSTPLFIIAAQRYLHITQDHTWLKQHASAVRDAFQYILRHVSSEDLYYESPRFCGAKRFALAVTYWKDSQWLCRPNGIPVWPVTFTLVQAQALAAIRAYAHLSDKMPLFIPKHQPMPYLEAGMLQALRSLIGNGQTIGVDAHGRYETLASDSLHALWYLKLGDLPLSQLSELENRSQQLETSHGYAAARSAAVSSYHGNVVWPFEQAFIHAGAVRHGLKRAQEVAMRVEKTLGFFATRYQFPERLAVIDEGLLTAKGPHTQQWTAAAYIYFKGLKAHPAIYLHPTVPALTFGAPRSLQIQYITALEKGKKFAKTRSEQQLEVRENSMECLDESSIGVLNDRRCDCADGSDEPGSVACADKLRSRGQMFKCHQGDKLIDYTALGNGICDCCDGSDEYENLPVHCPHSCVP